MLIRIQWKFKLSKNVKLTVIFTWAVGYAWQLEKTPLNNITDQFSQPIYILIWFTCKFYQV